MCVFSGQERTERFLLFPIARVRDCLLTAHLPTSIIRNFMHTFGQLGSLFPALNFPAASKENFSPGWKLAGWHYRFTHPDRLLVHFLEAFWKLFFIMLSLSITGELLVDAGTIKNTILPFIFTHRLHQLWWIRIPLRCEGGPVFIPTGRLLGKGGWRLGGVCKGLSAERKRVNHVCNRTDFPLKWETEVGSVQIYGTP